MHNCWWYQTAKSDMDLLIAADDSRAFLTSWVSWWHEWRGFIFCAFTNPMHRKEPGWSDSRRLGSPRLSLLKACQADTQDASLLDMEIKAYLTGPTPGGKGCSFADRACKQHEAEEGRAKSTGKEMCFSSMGCSLMQAPHTNHLHGKRKRLNQSLHLYQHHRQSVKV